MRIDVPIRTCETCLIEYPDRAGLHTCSMGCRDERTRRKRLERYEDRTCAVCGSTFNVARLIAGMPNPAKLCGMTCVGENNRRLKLGSETVAREDVECRNPTCGRVIRRRVTDTKWEFCSKSCAFFAKRDLILHAPRAHLFDVRTNDGQVVSVRSKWEAVFLKQFIEPRGMKWLYEAKTIVLDDGKTHYTPDFYLEDDDVFVEIKGFRKSNAWKASAARKLGFNVIMADKHVLQSVYGLDMREKNLNSVCVKA